MRALILPTAVLALLVVPTVGQQCHAEEATTGAEAVTASGEEQELESGRAAGQYVPTFHTRAVTGSLMNRTVCYVCRNGGRPVVMLLMRKLEPGYGRLLEKVDTVVDDNRAVGLRSFGVLLSDDPFDDVSQVQTFSFDNEIATPLAVASEAVAGPNGQNVHEEAALTVVLYRKRRVESTFAFRAGQLADGDVNRIVERIHAFIGDDNDGAASNAVSGEE